MRHSCLLPRYGLSSRPCSAASMRFGRGGSTTARHISAAIAHTAAGTSNAAPTPWSRAMGGMVRAAMATPRGTDICLIPMANPRRCGGNQPTTTRPLALFALAAAIPPSRSRIASRGMEEVNTAATAASAVRPSPTASTSLSPIRSTSTPQAIRVNMMPTVGMATTSPAAGRLRPRSSCKAGMRNAAPLMNTAPAVCASMPRASMNHRLNSPMSDSCAVASISSPSQYMDVCSCNVVPEIDPTPARIALSGRWRSAHHACR